MEVVSLRPILSNAKIDRYINSNTHTKMVPERGFEPPTYALRMRRSTN